MTRGLDSLAQALLDEVAGQPAQQVAERLAALADALDPAARWERAFLHGVARAAEDARRLAAGWRIVAVRMEPDRSATFPIDPSDPPGETFERAILRAVHAALSPARAGAAR